MPRGDGTGPLGRGAMGRGLGPCGGAIALQYGAGLGLGLLLRQCRRGSRQWFGVNNNVDQAAAQTPKELLQAQREALQRRIEAVDKQMENL